MRISAKQRQELLGKAWSRWSSHDKKKSGMSAEEFFFFEGIKAERHFKRKISKRMAA